ncbi:MAG: protein-glutamate O-methyltransferase CheR [Clostridia bacterium]|nr:protein-glutamate O-methyltransferase CheR [Clostridia bacterium]
MTDLQFEKFKKIIEKEFGNTVSQDKRTTLEIKVDKIIKRYHGGTISVDQLLKKIEEEGKHSRTWETFVDEITVHKTNFYRENAHFDYIEKNITKIMDEIPRIRQNREIRVWCAAASSGEEPYSIAMMLKEILPPGYNIKFLASDISEKVLAKAIAGVYPKDIEHDVPANRLEKYFDKLPSGEYCVKDELKNLVTFRKVNLCDPFIFKHKFDIVFCRNVMIYFDEDLRLNILKKIHNDLVDNGVLLLGLSETIGNKCDFFKLQGSSIYKK